MTPSATSSTPQTSEATSEFQNSTLINDDLAPVPQSQCKWGMLSFAALLSPIGGILIADYFVCRRCQLNVAALYQPDGEYRYANGFDPVAIVAFLLGVLPSLQGFLVQVKRLNSDGGPPFVVGLFHYAWFIGFAIAFFIYVVAFRIQHGARRTMKSSLE